MGMLSNLQSLLSQSLNIVILGSFCTSGATEATPCQAGTYGATDGLGNSSDCDTCPAGMQWILDTSNLKYVQLCM